MTFYFMAHIFIAEGLFFRIGANLFFIYYIVYPECLAGAALFFFVGAFLASRCVQ